MPLKEPGAEPDGVAERAADAAIEAARDALDAEGARLKEVVVMLRAEGCTPDAATAASADVPIDGTWLLADLLGRAQVLAESMGREMRIGFLDGPVGRG